MQKRGKRGFAKRLLHLHAGWGCGPSPKTSYTDMLFMVLSVLRILKNAEAHMQGFKMKKTMFDNNLAKVSQSSSALSNMVCLTISLFCFLSWRFFKIINICSNAFQDCFLPQFISMCDVLIKET